MNYTPQKTQILNLLLDNPYVCTSDMLKHYVPDYRRRLCDLKADGYILESRRCQQHDYHRGGSKEWRVVAPQTQEIAPQQEYIQIPILGTTDGERVNFKANFQASLL